MRIVPFKMGSASAKALAQALNIKRVRPNSSTFSNRRRLPIINWGFSGSFSFPTPIMLNRPGAVGVARNKLSTFYHLDRHEVSIPPFTEDRAVAAGWLESDPDLPVYCRTQLSAHSGNGIVIATSPDELVDAPLYTQKVKIKTEYRVHIMNGRIIDVQQKKRRLDENGNGTGNSLIRNHANGWVFTRNGVTAPLVVLQESMAAVGALGLDFGAVDIGYNHYYQRAFVFEVNSAPALVGTTLTNYVNAITAFQRGEIYGKTIEEYQSATGTESNNATRPVAQNNTADQSDADRSIEDRPETERACQSQRIHNGSSSQTNNRNAATAQSRTRSGGGIGDSNDRINFNRILADGSTLQLSFPAGTDTTRLVQLVLAPADEATVSLQRMANDVR